MGSDGMILVFWMLSFKPTFSLSSFTFIKRLFSSSSLSAISVVSPREAPQLVQFSSVTQSCPTLCYPMNCSTPGLPVHHQLPELLTCLVTIFGYGLLIWKISSTVLCMCSLTQSSPTLCDPMNHSPPDSSVHGTFQARILEWVAISYSVLCIYMFNTPWIHSHLFFPESSLQTASMMQYGPWVHTKLLYHVPKYEFAT